MKKKRGFKKTPKRSTEAAMRRLQKTAAVMAADLTETTNKLLAAETQLRLTRKERMEAQRQADYTGKQARNFFEYWQAARKQARANLVLGAVTGFMVGAILGLAVANLAVR